MRLFQIDAFTETPFRGNPAAVCFLDGARDDAWMQSLAAEMNLSETAYLIPQNDGWSLRWFTPATEVELCGHATLASAHALWEESLLPADRTARFHTLSGLLTASRDGDWIDLDFPATPEETVEAPAGLLDALNVKPLYVGRNRFDYIVEVASADEVRRIRPNYEVLRQLPVRGIIVTSRGDGDYDFVSRFFAPGAGVDEDPVTGSAHCCLAPFWASRLGKSELLAFQASARGGIVRVRLAGDRVKLGGHAVTVFRADLAV